MKSLNKNVVTLATGKSLYIHFAINLARSFFWWHPDSEIQFQIITDQESLIPKELKSKIKIIAIKPGELGEGFSPKLHLDKLAQDGQTLFIDSDCLIFGKLDPIFEQFKGHDVSVVGSYINKGEWFGDIVSICKQFSVPHLPKFNGGIYYLEKGGIANQVYKKAREIENIYDRIGFVRLRNRPADEVIMALAMQLYNQRPILDDGKIMSDPQACPGKYHIDVISGVRFLTNPSSPHPKHQDWYPFEKVEPTIIHFLGYFTEHYPYKRECYRLKKALSQKLNWQTEIYTKIMIEWPGKYKTSLKNSLRPLYRTLFGTRKIRPSKRIA